MTLKDRISPGGAITMFLALVFFVLAVFIRHTRIESVQGYQIVVHGIPALLVIPSVLLPSSRSFMVRGLKATLITLLMMSTLVGELMICVALASPLILGIVLAVLGVVDQVKKPRQLLAAPAILMALFVLGFAGNTNNVIEAQITTNLNFESVRSSIGSTSEIAPIESGLLGGIPGARFPQPVALEGSGLELGDTRTVTFDDDGELELLVVRSDSNGVTFDVVENSSSFGNWLDWQSTRFEWSSLESGQTRVSASIQYERRVAPGWYFHPLVTAGMNQAADHLLAELVEDIE